MDTTKPLAERIRSARESAGYRNMSAVPAAHDDINKATYTSHESGRRNPTDQHLRRYAEIFGVSFDWLKTGSKRAMSIEVRYSAGRSWQIAKATRPIFEPLQELTYAHDGGRFAVWIGDTFNLPVSAGGYMVCVEVQHGSHSCRKAGTIVLVEERTNDKRMVRHTFWVYAQDGKLTPAYDQQESREFSVEVIGCAKDYFVTNISAPV
jgi:transcriptional regulator with XRE-family HTH domain